MSALGVVKRKALAHSERDKLRLVNRDFEPDAAYGALPPRLHVRSDCPSERCTMFRELHGVQPLKQAWARTACLQTAVSRSCLCDPRSGRSSRGAAFRAAPPSLPRGG